jgi:hypothetical protein
MLGPGNDQHRVMVGRGSGMAFLIDTQSKSTQRHVCAKGKRFKFINRHFVVTKFLKYAPVAEVQLG